MTDDIAYIIETLTAAGHGWKKYADSVSRQEKLSQKQIDTLKRMYTKLRYLQSAAEMRERNWKPKMSTYEDKFIGSLDHDQIGEWGVPEH